MNRSTFFRLWRTVATQAGLPEAKRHPHVGKHTCGTLLAQQNANVFAIKQHLGHRALASSAIYCRMSDNHAAEIAKSAWMAAF